MVAEIARTLAESFTEKDLKSQSRVGLCGQPLAKGGVVLYPGNGTSSGRGRLVWSQSCGRWQMCSRCAQTRFNERHRELSARIERAQQVGQVVVLATFTVSHGREESTGLTVRALLRTWKYLRIGGGWRAIEETHGIQGVFRVLEPSFKEGRCHPHIHALIFLAPEAHVQVARDSEGRLDLRDLRNCLYRRWAKKLVNDGFSPHPDVAVHVQVVDGKPEGIAGYVLNSLLGPRTSHGAFDPWNGIRDERPPRSRNAFHVLADIQKMVESGEPHSKIVAMLLPLLGWLEACAGRQLFTSTDGLFQGQKRHDSKPDGAEKWIILRGPAAQWLFELGEEERDKLVNAEPDARALTRELTRRGLEFEWRHRETRLKTASRRLLAVKRRRQ